MLAGALLLAGLSATAWAQDTQQSTPLGDVARKSRKERSAKDHVPAKRVLNKEYSWEQTWTSRACKQQLCSSLAVTLPTERKWDGRETLIPLRAHPDDKTHSVHFYELGLSPAYDLETGKRLFLQRFRAPYFSDRPAKFEFEERTHISGWHATMPHFTVENRLYKFRGMAIIAVVPTGIIGLVCLYRDDDFSEGSSICDDIATSAKIEVPEQFRPHADPPDDPADDPPDNDDPPEAP
jgi:hypothetical protein